MKKSQLIEIIKEEITKILQEKKQTANIGVTPQDLQNIGFSPEEATKISAAISKFRNPKDTIENVPLSAQDNKALASIFPELIDGDTSPNTIANFLNKLRAVKVRNT
jgi:hypothetical protein